MRRILLSFAVFAALCSMASANPVLFGTIGGSGNSYPFGGGDTGATSTRYQQVYNSANFPTGSQNVTSISFFNTDASSGNNYRDGTYSFYLSTTSRPVNGLDTINLNNNLGANNQLFAVANLSGVMPLGTITFAGTPFMYDPSAGNLLLEVVYSGVQPSPPYRGFFDAMNGNFGTSSSRAHNYGTAFESWGLVTQFNVTAVPEPASMALFGGLVGIGGLVARRRMAKAAA